MLKVSRLFVYGKETTSVAVGLKLGHASESCGGTVKNAGPHPRVYESVALELQMRMHTPNTTSVCHADASHLGSRL